MKIVRMWDREERGGYQFAMVRVKWLGPFGKNRRIGRAKGGNFCFIDTGKFTPRSEAEVLWESGQERPLSQWEAQAKRLQAAYLVGK